MLIARMSGIAAAWAVCSLGCSTSSSPATGGGNTGDAAVTNTGNAQTPPLGREAVEAWIAAGSYKQWHCESAPHASRNPSVHSFNRICSNDLVASNSTSAAPWPEGAAAVKELYAEDTDASTDDDASAPDASLTLDPAPVGYAVYLKTAADSAAGASWYWYERVPLTSAAPHDSNGVVADGFGGADGGPSNLICVGCHSASGTTGHLPSPNGHDFVYTPVN